MSTSVISIGSMRHTCRKRSSTEAQLVEVIAEKTAAARREFIQSPMERRRIAHRFWTLGQSISKLARDFASSERAIENALRFEGFRLFPPTGGAVAPIRRAA